MELKKKHCLLIALLIGGAFFAQAQTADQQNKKQLPREVPSPEKIAQKKTDQMKVDLQLTEKQYQKIYKLNFKEEKGRFAKMSQGQNERGALGGRPDRGGRPPMGSDMTFDGDAPHGMPPGMDREDSDKKQQKTDTMEKKIKKILTSEQYAKWLKICQERKPKGAPDF